MGDIGIRDRIEKLEDFEKQNFERIEKLENLSSEQRLRLMAMIQTNKKELSELKEKITYLSDENATLYTQVDDDALKRAENEQKIEKLEKKVSEMKSWEDYLAHGGLLEQIMERVEKSEKKLDDVHTEWNISENDRDQLEQRIEKISKWSKKQGDFNIRTLDKVEKLEKDVPFKAHDIELIYNVRKELSELKETQIQNGIDWLETIEQQSKAIEKLEDFEKQSFERIEKLEKNVEYDREQLSTHIMKTIEEFSELEKELEEEKQWTIKNREDLNEQIKVLYDCDAHNSNEIEELKKNIITQDENENVLLFEIKDLKERLLTKEWGIQIIDRIINYEEVLQEFSTILHYSDDPIQEIIASGYKWLQKLGGEK